jgi:hypothetical protein
MSRDFCPARPTVVRRQRSDLWLEEWDADGAATWPSITAAIAAP